MTSVSPHLSRLPAPGQYARYVRQISALILVHGPTARTKDPGDPFGRVVPLADIKTDACRALQRRINIRGGMDAANDPMPDTLLADARAINDYKAKRIRFYYLGSPKLRTRYADWIARSDD